MSRKSERGTAKNEDNRQLFNDSTEMFGAGVSAAVSAVLGLLGGPGGAAIGGVAGKL